MLIIGNVARTEDVVVAVEFDEMRLMVSCAEGEGEFSSWTWTWFTRVRGGKFENLVDGDRRATVVERDEDKANATKERVELMHSFCFLLFPGERSVIWPQWTIILVTQHEHNMSCFKHLGKWLRWPVNSEVFKLHTSSNANLPEKLAEMRFYQISERWSISFMYKLKIFVVFWSVLTPITLTDKQDILLSVWLPLASTQPWWFFCSISCCNVADLPVSSMWKTKLSRFNWWWNFSPLITK